LALGLEGIVPEDFKSLYVEGPAATWHRQKSKDYNRRDRVSGAEKTVKGLI
jgi:hypothetical protein